MTEKVFFGGIEVCWLAGIIGLVITWFDIDGVGELMS